jgi:hypothetical protein
MRATTSTDGAASKGDALSATSSTVATPSQKPQTQLAEEAPKRETANLSPTLRPGRLRDGFVRIGHRAAAPKEIAEEAMDMLALGKEKEEISAYLSKHAPYKDNPRKLERFLNQLASESFGPDSDDEDAEVRLPSVVLGWMREEGVRLIRKKEGGGYEGVECVEKLQEHFPGVRSLSLAQRYTRTAFEQVLKEHRARAAEKARAQAEESETEESDLEAEAEEPSKTPLAKTAPEIKTETETRKSADEVDPATPPRIDIAKDTPFTSGSPLYEFMLDRMRQLKQEEMGGVTARSQVMSEVGECARRDGEELPPEDVRKFIDQVLAEKFTKAGVPATLTPQKKTYKAILEKMRLLKAEAGGDETVWRPMLVKATVNWTLEHTWKVLTPADAEILIDKVIDRQATTPDDWIRARLKERKSDDHLWMPRTTLEFIAWHGDMTPEDATAAIRRVQEEDAEAAKAAKAEKSRASSSAPASASPQVEKSQPDATAEATPPPPDDHVEETHAIDPGALAAAYKTSDAAGVESLRSLYEIGYPSAHVLAALRGEEVGSSLRWAILDMEHVGFPSAEILKAAREQEEPASLVLEFLHSEKKLALTDAFEHMKAAGFSAGDIARGAQERGKRKDEVEEALEGAGFLYPEAASAARRAYKSKSRSRR